MKSICALQPTALLKYSLFNKFPSLPASSSLVFNGFSCLTLSTHTDTESPPDPGPREPYLALLTQTDRMASWCRSV